MLKKFIKILFSFVLVLSLLLSYTGCNNSCKKHNDNDENGVCDKCHSSVFVYFDFYSIGNLANKTADNEKLTNYFKYAKQNDQNAVLLSTGDVHKDAESTNDWLNDLDFDATAIGNSDLKLGTQFVNGVAKNSDLQLLAINLFDSKKDKLASFCKASTIIKSSGYKIGVIGASIVSEQDDVYAKTGDELTALVMDESNRLRKKGVDFIVYIINTQERDSSYYNESLSNGYVDLVFEGNTNESYSIKDSAGVYHLQNDQGQSVGICHAEVSFNTVTNVHSVRDTGLISDEEYTSDEYIPQEESSGDSETDNSSVTENKNNKPNEDKGNNQDGSIISSNLNSSSTTSSNTGCKKHKDKDNNEICDVCDQSVIVYFDFYNINDLHGKLDDADSHIGVDELSTYLKNERKSNPNSVFLSSGDMWQGQAESNMTKGIIMTDWMNEMDFTAMALGNHEYDWGSEYIRNNDDLAEFPFLAINVYDRSTNKLVDYCKASAMVEANGLQIGIIGAIGDCYSSIAVDKCEDVYFKVGRELTNLVKAEADRLRDNGADFIVYILHDGYDKTNTNSVQQISASQISSYYDVALSDGYIDLVFEGHTHQGYMLKDQHGVYHLQNRGDNKGGISHAEVAINSVTEKATVTEVDLVSTYEYQDLADDPIVDKLLQKYDAQISAANEILGYNRSYRNSEYLEQIVANLYYEAGEKEWGDKYKIVLGGGFIKARSPYNLPAGNVTYGQLQSLFTFDNQITLCSIKGRDLKQKFLETNNSDYFICCGDYGNSVRNNIDITATYYVVVDNYTAYYAPNKLTVVEEYDPNIFARDLLAEYIKKGGLS